MDTYSHIMKEIQEEATGSTGSVSPEGTTANHNVDFTGIPLKEG
jgi:hypothetical protein